MNVVFERCEIEVSDSNPSCFDVRFRNTNVTNLIEGRRGRNVCKRKGGSSYLGIEFENAVSYLIGVVQTDPLVGQRDATLGVLTPVPQLFAVRNMCSSCFVGC